jgi:5-formyltetrahydrofolate cyclo-ligase
MVIIQSMPDTIPEAKKQLRTQCRQKRTALGADFQRQASAVICGHIEAWSLFQEADAILTYLPMRGEVDLRPLLDHAPGKRWLLPRIQPDGRMSFHAYDPARLVRHPFGMLEPAADLPFVAAEQIQLALVPGLAFDNQGWRLGYGGGFFDRFLAGFAGVSAGVTYCALQLDQIPHHHHDIPVQYLVTEEGLSRCRAG